MTPRFVRPALLSLLALGASACTGVEADPNRFENMAERVAEIPVETRPAEAGEAGLRPASDLRVEVMEPHDLWDARDGGLRGAIQQVGPKVAEAAAPAVADAVVRRVSAQVQAPVAKPAAATPGATIQLGAFSSEAAARGAWADLTAGPAGPALAGMTPHYERVEVNGRTLTRLKVGPVPAHAAAVVCRAAEIADPWCRKPR